MIDLSTPPINGDSLNPHPHFARPGYRDYLQTALEFRAWGWTTLPLGTDKRPIGRWKHLQDRRPTDRQIGRMFDRAGSNVGGVAVITGKASGGRDWVLAVRDYDQFAAYQEWADNYPELASQLPTVITPRPGAHVYCRLRGPEVFVKRPDGELRASRRQYVVLPPSRHPSGRSYRWYNRPCSLQEFLILDLKETGFIPTSTISSLKDYSQYTKTFITQQTTSNRPPNPLNGMCPIWDAAPNLKTLPTPVREAVLRSLPRHSGERNERLLYLARSLADIKRDTPPAEWVSVVLCWWWLAMPVIGTKTWDETWRDFRRAWNSGRLPISESRPFQLMAAAAAQSMDPRLKIVNAVEALSESLGGTCHLSVRTAANVAGVSKSHAARLLTDLVHDEVLELVKPGTQSSRKRQAAVYRMNPGMTP
jgi:hypothetical protein